MPPYEYRDLQDPTSIRILTLYPSDSQAEAPVTASISVRAPDEDYEALSWCWGHDEESEAIRIVGDDGYFDLLVKPNLAAGLKQLRYGSTDFRKLWVDAICINQKNTTEKNSQVPMMAEIYGGATNVCVWLGEQDPGTESALKFIKDEVLDLSNFDALVENRSRFPGWVALTALMSRPWFSRRWIVQEIALAQHATINCGKDSITWSEFRNAVDLLTRGAERLSQLAKGAVAVGYRPEYFKEVHTMTAIRLLHTIDSMFRKSSSGEILRYAISLEELVLRMGDFKCGIPQDTFYALLALASDTYAGRRMGLTTSQLPKSNISGHLDDNTTSRENNVSYYHVDYGLTFPEACRNFMQHAFSTSNTLDLLCRPWAPKEANLPSWVNTVSNASFEMVPLGPWIQTAHRQRRNANSLVGGSGIGWTNYNAALHTSAAGAFRFSDKLADGSISLFVKGFILDTVATVEDTAFKGIIPPTWLQNAWSNKTRHLVDRFWRTLVADRDPDGMNVPAFYTLAWRYIMNQLDPLRGSIDTVYLLEHSDQPLHMDFLKRVQSVVWGRRLIKTKPREIRFDIFHDQDLLGLASEKVQVGDCICILYGCSVPVVLRKTAVKGTDEGSFVYEFLGEAYIHGMMDGEAIQLSQDMEQDYPVQEFELR